MSIYLGNLKETDLFDGDALKKFKEFCEKNEIQRIDNCEKAGNTKGAYHIFNFPPAICCCGKETADKIRWFCENVEQPKGNWKLEWREPDKKEEE